MNSRKLRMEIINKHWNNDDPKVERVCKKLSKKIVSGQRSQIDTLGNMLLTCHD